MVSAAPPSPTTLNLTTTRLLLPPVLYIDEKVSLVQCAQQKSRDIAELNLHPYTSTNFNFIWLIYRAITWLSAGRAYSKNSV